MARLLWTFLAFLVRLVLSLRYRVEVRGLEKLTPEQLNRPGGTLFLPNHPAHIDPLLISLLLWPRFRIRPLVVEYVYRQTWIKPLMRFVNALPMPNFETSVNQIKIKKAEQALAQITQDLERGDNFLLYPAGKLKSQGREVLGGASAVHDLLQAYPEAKVVLIRTTGLWGSSFSRALTGKSPDIKQAIGRGMLTALKNGLFFIPKRSVLIEIEPEPKGLPRASDRLTLNRFLERWYNHYEIKPGKRVEEEPLSLISRSCFYRDVPKVYEPKKRVKRGEGTLISSQTTAKIYAEIGRIVAKPQLQIRPEMSLALDLGMDSLQIAELAAFLGQHQDLEEFHPQDLDTVQSVLEIAEGNGVERRLEPMGHKPHFSPETHRPPPSLPMGRTIPEAFLNACDRMGSFTACGDDLIGTLSYAKFKRSALVLAEEFRKMPHAHIGILLPASAAASLLIFAVQLASKTPVMLNWTLGSRYLDDMVKTAKVGVVISSWRFLERLSHVDFGSLIDRLLLLEDVRQNLSLRSKLRGAALSFFSAKPLLKWFLQDCLNEEDNAVVLFTSGTEASPKGVPLTHKNILTNLRAGMQCIELKSDDILYAILPPFHSFGFSIAAIFPFMGGVKVAFYPDPTDSIALAEGISRWKPTIICSAPSFFKGLFHAAKKEQLASIRLFVTGAEKAPPDLGERVAKLGSRARLIEGYGITECSPILSLTRLNVPPKGVGRPIANIELITIHPETQERLPEHSTGEVCVRGPNVFRGYLGDVKSPFIEIDGKSWYRTGDIGHIDQEGDLILSGRLKRFTKIGGEMISLGAVEEAIARELISQNKIAADEPTLAVCVDESIVGKPQLILFSTVELDLDAANEILRRSRLSRLIKISAVNHIREIPLLGTGKTDYRSLQAIQNK